MNVALSYLFVLFDLLFATWFFYVWLVGFSLWTFIAAAVVLDKDNDDFHYGIGFLFGAVLLAAGWHWKDFGGWLADWSHLPYVVGGYVIIGFLVALYKWTMVLFDFRRSNPAALIAKARTNSYASAYHASRKDHIEAAFKDKCVVTQHGGDEATATYSVYPNWRRHPIASWWAYWPVFAFSVVFDPIERAIRAAFNALRRFWDWMGSLVAVKG